MTAKSYTITFGLKEGYKKNGKVHDLSAAEKVILNWAAQRLNDRKPIVTGLLTIGKMIFQNPETGSIVSSPTATYSGELVEEEQQSWTLREVKHILEDLALEIKRVLAQQEIFIKYKKESWKI